MNHVPMKMTAYPAVHPARVTRRTLAKQRTREKILASARELFAERGYDGATIRDIARGAGLSTGAVFASFADKAELFGDIVSADYQALAQAMGEAARPDAPVAEALKALFAAAFAFHAGQIQLTRASLAASWSRDLAAERRDREMLRPILELIAEPLRRAAQRGEIRREVDERLVAGLLWDLHLAGCRAAVFDARSAEDLTARFGDKLDVILAGVLA